MVEPTEGGFFREYGGPPGARATAAWWKRGPDDFAVARERDGDVAGYYVLVDSARLDTSSPADGPVLAQWAAHLADNPVAPGERILFLRRWLSRVAAELGTAPSSLLDIDARELVVGTHRAPLTRREFDLLHYLVQRAGNVVHREDLLTDVWGDGGDVTSNVVDVVVRSLRKKLAERANVIATISGIGYRLCAGQNLEH